VSGIPSKPGEAKKCRTCARAICFPGSGPLADYNPQRHGPCEAVGFWLDIDGEKTSEGFTVGGSHLTGQRLESNEDPESRGGAVFKVYPRHRCSPPTDETSTYVPYAD